MKKNYSRCINTIDISININTRMNFTIPKFFSNMSMDKMLSSAIVVTFFWEHYGRQKQINFRPSFGLKKITEKSQYCFEKMGKGFAWTSSYLTFFNTKNLEQTSQDILEPVYDLLLSPTYTFKG